MKKIPTLFVRDHATKRVTEEVTPGCEWVQAHEGMATLKYDGTCVLIRDGRMYKRYELKKGKTPPENFEPATDWDEATGKQQGWVPVGEGPEDRWHREALRTDGVTHWEGLPDGTYELCGPKIQGNPEGMSVHMLVPHGHTMLPAFPVTFDEIREAFADDQWTGEGVVWHHRSDGRMAKIKVRDFGLQRKRQ